MRKKWFNILPLLLLAAFALVECAIRKGVVENDISVELKPEDYGFNVPDGWPNPVYDFANNPIDSSKVEIGRRLFYDPKLSEDGTISCESCHSPFLAFTHSDHKLSHGIYDRIGTRNSPTLQNLAWQPDFMWDGIIFSLDEQPLNPLTSHVEMSANLDSIILYLENDPYYSDAFKNSFGEVSLDNLLLCLSQFMLQMNSHGSKYDQVVNGVEGVSFTEMEAEGYQVFKKYCASCHQEPLFTNYSYQSNGLSVDTMLKDEGRMNTTGLIVDSLLFRVPTLRNIEVSGPYMHDGRYKNLPMVLFHYSTLDTAAYNLSEDLKHISWTENDKRNLVQFLKTLTDKSFLRNKSLWAPRM